MSPEEKEKKCRDEKKEVPDCRCRKTQCAGNSFHTLFLLKDVDEREREREKEREKESEREKERERERKREKKESKRNLTGMGGGLKQKLLGYRLGKVAMHKDKITIKHRKSHGCRNLET